MKFKLEHQDSDRKFRGEPNSIPIFCEMWSQLVNLCGFSTWRMWRWKQHTFWPTTLPRQCLYSVHNFPHNFPHIDREICKLLSCRYVDKNGEPNPRLKRPCLMNFRPRSAEWVDQVGGSLLISSWNKHFFEVQEWDPPFLSLPGWTLVAGTTFVRSLWSLQCDERSSCAPWGAVGCRWVLWFG